MYTSGLELRKMTDARSKFELRRLKVPELKHFLRGKRIPYTEKEQKSLCWYYYYCSGPGVLRGNPVLRFGLGLLYGKY